MAAAPGTRIAECHDCRFGMEAKDELGTGLVKKPTKFLTKSPCIFEKLNIKCENPDLPEVQRHRRVQLVGGRARQAQIYPKRLCQAVCEGVAQQKKRDESELREISLLDHEEMKATVRYACSLHPDELGVCPVDLVAPGDFLHDPDPPQWATDDVTNEPPDPALVRRSRAEEI